MPYQGGSPRLIKSLPCAENFFLSWKNDLFVICYLKVIKNNQIPMITYILKKFPKKYSVHISSSRRGPHFLKINKFNFFKAII